VSCASRWWEADLPEQQTLNDVEVVPPSLVFLSKAQVLKRIPVTGVTLWSWVRAGKFPKPRSSNK
jgi:hypothetical protein